MQKKRMKMLIHFYGGEKNAGKFSKKKPREFFFLLSACHNKVDDITVVKFIIPRGTNKRRRKLKL